MLWLRDTLMALLALVVIFGFAIGLAEGLAHLLT